MRPAPLSIIVGLFGLSAITPLAAQTAPVWRYAAPDLVSSFHVTPFGILLADTRHGLVGLNPDSGTVLWTRPELAGLAPQSYVTVGARMFAVLGFDGGIELLDLLTGASRWRTPPPPTDLRPRLPLSRHGLLLAYGYTDPNRPALVALALEDGSVRWERPQDANRMPSASDHGAVPPHELLADSIVYLPIDDRLHALRIRDGTPIWREAADLPGRIAKLERTAQGLVVQGDRPWLRLIDPMTGELRWEKRFGKAVVTRFLVADGRVHVVVDEKVRALDLDDGAVTEMPIEFEGGDRPYHLERRPGGLLLVGRQNLMLLDSTGMQRYHAYHPAPGRSTLEKVGLTVGLIVGLTVTAFLSSFDELIAEVTGTEPLFDQWPWDQVSYHVTHWNPSIGKRYAASAEARNYVYSVADVADSIGRKGPAFLKLHKDDGRVVGRVWLEEKRPDFQLDPIAGMLYIREGREILAFRM